MMETNNALYALINSTTEKLLKLRDEHPFCTVCGKPTKELFCYAFPMRDRFWVRWVCYECYEQLEVGYDCGRM